MQPFITTVDYSTQKYEFCKECNNNCIPVYIYEHGLKMKVLNK